MARKTKRPGLKELAASVDDYDGNVFWWEGDLVVDGDFCTRDADVTWLIVNGDVIISGLYDAPDELTFVTVTGSLRAADIITATSLDVFGDVHSKGFVFGDYNDGGAHIRGSLTARVFAPMDHPFRIDGVIRAQYVLEDRIRKKGESGWDDLPLVEPFSIAKAFARLRRGMPVLRET